MPTRNAPGWTEWVGLGLILALGVLLRLYRLDLKSLWFDEAATYLMVQGSLAETFLRNATENSAPPLFPLLLALITGPEASEFALRLPAASAGALAIPPLWLLARQFLPGPLALLPPLLVAIAPTQLEFSQQVREYSLAFTVSVLLLLAYQRFLSVPDARRALALSLVLALGLLVQYGLGLLAGGLGVVALGVLGRRAWTGAPGNLSTDRYGPLRRWGLAQLPALAVLLALARTTLPGQRAAMGPGMAGYLADRIWDGTGAGLLGLFFGPRADFIHFAYPSRLMLVLTLVGVGLWLTDRTRWRVAAFLLVPVGLTGVAALAGVYPYGGIRQTLYLLPLVYVAAVEPLRRAGNALATALGRGPRPPPRWAAGGALLLALLLVVPVLPQSLALLANPGPEPLRQTLSVLLGAVRRTPGHPLYVYAGAVPAFRYYWAGHQEPWQQGAPHGSGLIQAQADAALPLVHAEIRAALAPTGALWLVVSHITNPDLAALLTPLRAQFSVHTLHSAGGSSLYFLQAPP